MARLSYVGQVWEWTSSSFEPYPGFRAFPYDGYSAVFFGTADYRVLRGGSWATHGKVGRHTFRNWDLPIRRQIFAGLGSPTTCRRSQEAGARASGVRCASGAWFWCWVGVRGRFRGAAGTR